MSTVRFIVVLNQNHSWGYFIILRFAVAKALPIGAMIFAAPR
jgi:hypothetical protein